MTENGSESLPFEPPEQENVRLRRLLAVHSIPIPQLAPENPPPAKAVEIAQPVDREERARRRIALFRSLFRGREDVYARRWDNDDGRHGHMPAALKDWKAINKSRPEERKKVDQKTGKFDPLTDAVINFAAADVADGQSLVCGSCVPREVTSTIFDCRTWFAASIVEALPGKEAKEVPEVGSGAAKRAVGDSSERIACRQSREYPQPEARIAISPRLLFCELHKFAHWILAYRKRPHVGLVTHC
jgi:hypothetical protein